MRAPPTALTRPARPQKFLGRAAPCGAADVIAASADAVAEFIVLLINVLCEAGNARRQCPRWPGQGGAALVRLDDAPADASARPQITRGRPR